MEVGRDAAEGDVVVVDLYRCHRTIEAVGRAAEGVGSARQRNRVLIARTGAVVHVEADDETRAHGREVHAVLAEEAEGLVLGDILVRIVADRPARDDPHAVVAEIRRHRQQRRLGLALEGGGHAERIDLAERERNVVGTRRGAELGLVQVADVLLVDRGERNDRLQHRIVGERAIPAQGAGAAVIAGVVLPAVAMGEVEAGAPGIVAVRITTARQRATPAMRADLATKFERWPGGRVARQHVDRTADRIRTIKGAARPF